MSLLALFAISLGLLLRKIYPPKQFCLLKMPLFLVFAGAGEIVLVLIKQILFAEILAYSLVLVWLYFHKNCPWYHLALVGITLNLIAIFQSGGMPVDPKGVNALGLPQPQGLHKIGDAFPLGDWIPLMGRLISPGDLFILASLSVLAYTGKFFFGDTEER